MITQAYFEDIQQVIISQIDKAKQSVFVAVAWLTDSAIFNELCRKAEQGIQVELLLVNDAINNDMAPFDHAQLKTCGGKVFFVPVQMDGSIMHHKFCVIDNTTVITGSYNWSKKAQINDENIVLTEEAEELADQFKREFQNIKSRLPGSKEEPVVFDYSKIMKRLEVIKSFAALEEEDEIHSQIKKLRGIPLPGDVIAIVNKLEAKQFGEALKLLEEFIKDKNRLAIYNDSEIFGLQLEIKSLEVQLNALENELVDAEKLVHEFSIRHTKELGVLIIKLLKLKREKAKTEQARDEAEEDEKTYREGYEANKDVVIPELSKEEKQSLTKMYREASMLCHPDKFSNEPLEKQKQAEELFKELAEAYSSNNTQRVNEILENLKKGILTTDPKNSIHKKDLLKSRLDSMKMKIKDILEKINQIKLTESFVTATVNTNWDEYFESAKVNLQQQIDDLENDEPL
jgi:hypothetical protein